MSSIERKEVERVVRLARLSMDEAELEGLQGDLARILSFVDALDAVDTEGVEPTAYVIPLATPLRDDVPEAPLSPEDVVRNAPEASGAAFVVPKVISGEDEG